MSSSERDLDSYFDSKYDIFADFCSNYFVNSDFNFVFGMKSDNHENCDLNLNLNADICQQAALQVSVPSASLASVSAGSSESQYSVFLVSASSSASYIDKLCDFYPPALRVPVYSLMRSSVVPRQSQRPASRVLAFSLASYSAKPCKLQRPALLVPASSLASLSVEPRES